MIGELKKQLAQRGHPGNTQRSNNSVLDTQHGSFFNKHYNSESQKMINDTAYYIKKYKD